MVRATNARLRVEMALPCHRDASHPKKKRARFVLYVNASRINVTNERTQLGTTRREWRRKNERDRPVRDLTLQNYNYGTTTARRRTRTERPFSISSISDAFSSKNLSERITRAFFRDTAARCRGTSQQIQPRQSLHEGYSLTSLCGTGAFGFPRT